MQAFRVEVDIAKLTKFRINIRDFIVLTLIKEGQTDLLKAFLDNEWFCHYNVKQIINPADEKKTIVDNYIMSVLGNLDSAGWIKVITFNNDKLAVEKRIKFNELFSIKDTKLVDDAFFKEYRNLFKETNKPGAMGDPNAVREKLEKFMVKNPQYSKAQILEATKRYISTQAPAYRFLQQADYFIYKQSPNSKIDQSRLLTFIEDTSQGNETNDFTKNV